MYPDRAGNHSTGVNRRDYTALPFRNRAHVWPARGVNPLVPDVDTPPALDYFLEKIKSHGGEKPDYLGAGLLNFAQIVQIAFDGPKPIFYPNHQIRAIVVGPLPSAEGNILTRSRRNRLMYSVVMAALLTTGSMTPAWGNGCHGCHGCHGCFGCFGGCYGSYNAFSCSGCYGCCGGCWSNCYGCHGGCWSNCYGCHGGCWGNCYGCHGGCWSNCYGCCGGCWGNGYGCGGGWGNCYGCYGGGFGYGGASVAPSYDYGSYGDEIPLGYSGGDALEGDNGAGTATLPPEEGQVFISLPADASLSVNGELTHLNSGEQCIVTPQLKPGQDYYYTLQAKMVQDGKVIAKEKRVLVRAGQRSNVDFNDLPAVATARR